MKRSTVLLLIPFLFGACVDGQFPYNSSGDQYQPRDCHYYGDCGRDYYRHDDDDYYRYERERRHREIEEQRREEEERRERDRWRDDHRDRDAYRNDHRESPKPAPTPAPKPQENVIRPSCPSGTQYDGSHCKIVDQKLRRPGGDGNINPCPKGMWVSGDRCVGK